MSKNLHEKIQRRDYLLHTLLERLDEAIPPKGHVRRGTVKALHVFFETQYHAMLEREMQKPKVEQESQ